MNKKWLKFGMTNFVTLLRVIGIFALLPVFKIYGGLATFLLSSSCFATDFIDGLMARKLSSSTFFGSLFDALSDKLFLVVNMILLASITPVAIIPIILELSIATISTIKYNAGLNIQSNIFGKIKMWVAGITISLSYLLVDKNFLNYLGADIVNKINKIDENYLFGAVIMPLVLSEIITLSSYIYSYNKEKQQEKHEEKNENNVLNEKKEEQIIEEEIKNASFKEILFEHDYYEKYKDYGNLKLVRSLSKKNKRR